MARLVTVSLNRHSERKVIKQINTLLKETRKRAPIIVKELARAAANSAAKMTIPADSESSGKSRHRRVKNEDKYRPIISRPKKGAGQYYVINKASNSKKNSNKKPRKANKSSGTQRYYRGSRGEFIMYTTKKISQKDARFTKITRMIKAWDRTKGRFYHVPTLTKTKYEKDTKIGKIPNYFAAKMGWLNSMSSFSKTIAKLNPADNLRSLSSSVNGLAVLDRPRIQMFNHCRYAVKRGGQSVPRRAMQKAYRGYLANLMKQRQKIIDKARKA